MSRIEAYSGDPHQLYDTVKEFGEEDHRAPITEEVEEFGENRTAGVPDVLHPIADALRRFCGQALQILISKMESYKKC